VDAEPRLALEHARAARLRAARIGVVREAAGITAYHAGEWAEALAELRAARRLTGDPVHLAIMADCERALGRPERALRLVNAPEAARLDDATRVELRIVEAGARRDLGEHGAALLALQTAVLDRAEVAAWSARLWYAYADALVAAGQPDNAAEWFLAAASVDSGDETDAEDRLAELGLIEDAEIGDVAETGGAGDDTAGGPADEYAGDGVPGLRDDLARDDLADMPVTAGPAPGAGSTLFREPAMDKLSMMTDTTDETAG